MNDAYVKFCSSIVLTSGKSAKLAITTQWHHFLVLSYASYSGSSVQYIAGYELNLKGGTAVIWANPVLVRIWSISSNILLQLYTYHFECSTDLAATKNPESSFFQRADYKRLIIFSCLAAFSSSPKSKIASIIFIVALNSPQQFKSHMLVI